MQATVSRNARRSSARRARLQNIGGCLVLIWCLAGGTTSFATAYNDGGMHTISAADSDVVVDNATTVNVIAGANITGTPDDPFGTSAVIVNDAGSFLNVSGGTVTGGDGSHMGGSAILGHGGSFDLSGGDFVGGSSSGAAINHPGGHGALFDYQAATSVSVSGGNYFGGMGFEAGDGLRLFTLSANSASISGGTFTGGVPNGVGMDVLPGYGLRAIGPVEVAISGGQFIAAYSVLGDGSTFNVTGGHFDGPIELINQAVLNANDGQFYALLMRDGSSATLNGGVFRFFDMHDTSVLDIYDGLVVANSIIAGSAEINLRGGSYISELGEFFENVRFDLSQDSVMNVYGTGLTIQNHLLQGTLADGTAIHLDVFLTDNAALNLIEIPEPSALSLAALGLFGLAGLRWRRDNRKNRQTKPH